jgi:hypothetical protein
VAVREGRVSDFIVVGVLLFIVVGVLFLLICFLEEFGDRRK